MSGFRKSPFHLALLLVSSLSPTLAEVVVERFDSDPAPLFSTHGESAHLIRIEPSPSRFPGDVPGSLAVTFDSLESTSRILRVLPSAVTESDDFVFGALITIRSSGFEPDPFGFHPITVSLVNTATTGDDRTGDITDFRADTFDTLELAYFPNVSPFFGGPFLSPTAFGEPIADDAFANFSFNSAEFTLLPDVTYLVELEHSAGARTLAVQVSVVSSTGRAVPLADGSIAADLSGLTGFTLDAIGVSMYHDGFNLFAQSGRSLLATVDYDLIFFGRKEEGRLPAGLVQALARLKRTSPLIRE